MPETKQEEEESLAELKNEYEDKLDRLKRQYERDLQAFRYEVEEREYRLKAYEEKFNKIKQPPLLYAYVVRKEGPDLDSSQVVVARSNELIQGRQGLVDTSTLNIREYVWVHPQTYSIVESSIARNEGVIAKVADILEGKLVITVDGDMEKRLPGGEKKEGRQK